MQARVQDEAPVLWLGTAGFTAAQAQQLAGPMEAGGAGLRWRHAPLGEADAWLIHGGRVERLGSGEILVQPGDPADAPLRLSLRDVTRPVAFAEPLPAGFEPLCRFDLGSAPSIEAALRRLEIWLRPMRARFALGRLVVAGGSELRHGIFHLASPGDGKLLAMLNFRNGQAALAPDLHPAQAAHAHWERRPAAAGKPPPGFVGMTTAQLCWTYVRHSQGRHLPSHYFERPLLYRGMPRVPLHWLSDAQLAILRELSLGPAPLPALQQLAGAPGQQLEQDLACLYYAAAITTTASKAARASRGRGESAWASVRASERSAPDNLGPEDGPASLGPTVPAWLPRGQ